MVLIGDWFIIKIAIYDKVLFFAHCHYSFSCNLIFKTEKVIDMFIFDMFELFLKKHLA